MAEAELAVMELAEADLLARSREPVARPREPAARELAARELVVRGSWRRQSWRWSWRRRRCGGAGAGGGGATQLRPSLSSRHGLSEEPSFAGLLEEPSFALGHETAHLGLVLQAVLGG